MSWKTEITSRFEHREELSPELLASEFRLPSSESLPELHRCLQVFAEEYGVNVGCLRADDSLRLFFDLPKGSNVVSSFFRMAAVQDSASELNHALKKRLRSVGRTLVCPPMTIGDYVAAWFGQF